MEPRFCPACGGPLAPRVEHGHERLACARCGRVHYRNSKPCVGAVILRQGQVLLSQRAREPKRGQWDFPGGFLEAGEEPLPGLAREVAEETGLQVRAARFLDAAVGDYAGEPTLNLSYLVEAEGEPVAADDSAALRWWPLAALPAELAWPHERRVLEGLARERA